MINMFESELGKLWFNFTDRQKNKTVLLIHGFMEDHEIWKNIAPSLNANMLVVDVMGFGKSIPSSTFDFSMKSQAMAIQQLLQHLNLSQIHVVGHSMGGYIALELSVLMPQLKIGLLHSTCVADSDERKLNRNKTIDVLEKDASIFIREFYWNLFAEHRKNEFAAIVEELKLKANKIPVRNIIETVKGLRDRKNNESTWKNLHDALMVAGTYDKLIDIQEVKGLAKINNAHFTELLNSGHMGFYEEPEKVIESVNDWL